MTGKPIKVAFLGKGGSGKSTLATAFVHVLRARSYSVLAIDADHNMDLSYSLGADPKVFIGTDPSFIKEHIGVSRTDTYQAALAAGRAASLDFTLSPVDAYTERMSAELEPGLRLMTAGPHTDVVRSQEACSHSLAAPLKVYVPLLKLNTHEAAVIDERAGTDPVATGILDGVDLAVIVREKTVPSSRVAEQIRAELGIAGISHLIVDNKGDGIGADTARVSQEIFAWFTRNP